jgi:hypothetical protein
VSVLFELLGGMIAEVFSPGGEDRSRGDGDVFLDGRWQEGELFFGPTKIVWDERIVFAPDQGWVELISDLDPPHPNFVVLHFRRAEDTLLLAVHRRELERVGAVLTLPL